MSVWGAIASGAGAVGGGVAGALMSAQTAKKQREFNAKESQKTRDWSKQRYRNRYKDTMKDMRKSGLNPLLAYRQGTGGGVPSGAMASASLGQEAGSMIAGASAGAGRALEAAIGMATKEKIQQDTATSAAQQHQLEEQKLKTQKETTLLSKEEPWALIMEQVAKEGVKPLLDYLIETLNTGKKVPRNLLDLLPSDMPPFPEGILHKPRKLNNPVDNRSLRNPKARGPSKIRRRKDVTR